MKKRSGPKPIPNKLPDFFRETPKGAAAKRGVASQPRRPVSPRKAAMNAASKAARLAAINPSVETTATQSSSSHQRKTVPPFSSGGNDYFSDETLCPPLGKRPTGAFAWQKDLLDAAHRILMDAGRLSAQYPSAVWQDIPAKNNSSKRKGKGDAAPTSALRVQHRRDDLNVGGHMYVQSPPGTGKSLGMYYAVQTVGRRLNDNQSLRPEYPNSAAHKGKKGISIIVVGTGAIVDQHRESFAGKVQSFVNADNDRKRLNKVAGRIGGFGAREVLGGAGQILFPGQSTSLGECRTFITDPSGKNSQTVVIMTWQALASAARAEGFGHPVNLLIFDECHIGGSDIVNVSFPRIIQGFSPWKCMFVSATLGPVDPNLCGSKDGTAYVHTFEDAASVGLINPTTLVELETGLNAQYLDVTALARRENVDPKLLEERQYLDARRDRSITQEMRHANLKDLASEFADKGIRRAMCGFLPAHKTPGSKLDKLDLSMQQIGYARAAGLINLYLSDWVLREQPDGVVRPAMFFCPNTDTALFASNYLNKKLEQIKRRQKTFGVLSGEIRIPNDLRGQAIFTGIDKNSDRKISGIISEFNRSHEERAASGDNAPIALFVVKMLREGFDFPDLTLGFSCAFHYTWDPSKAANVYQQMGRLTRTNSAFKRKYGAESYFYYARAVTDYYDLGSGNRRSSTDNPDLSDDVNGDHPELQGEQNPSGGDAEGSEPLGGDTEGDEKGRPGSENARSGPQPEPSGEKPGEDQANRENSDVGKKGAILSGVGGGIDGSGKDVNGNDILVTERQPERKQVTTSPTIQPGDDTYAEKAKGGGTMETPNLKPLETERQKANPDEGNFVYSNSVPLYEAVGFNGHSMTGVRVPLLSLFGGTENERIRVPQLIEERMRSGKPAPKPKSEENTLYTRINNYFNGYDARRSAAERVRVVAERAPQRVALKALCEALKSAGVLAAGSWPMFEDENIPVPQLIEERMRAGDPSPKPNSEENALYARFNKYFGGRDGRRSAAERAKVVAERAPQRAALKALYEVLKKAGKLEADSWPMFEDEKVSVPQSIEERMRSGEPAPKPRGAENALYARFNSYFSGHDGRRSAAERVRVVAERAPQRAALKALYEALKNAGILAAGSWPMFEDEMIPVPQLIEERMRAGDPSPNKRGDESTLYGRISNYFSGYDATRQDAERVKVVAERALQRAALKALYEALKNAGILAAGSWPRFEK